MNDAITTFARLGIMGFVIVFVIVALVGMAFYGFVVRPDHDLTAQLVGILGVGVGSLLTAVGVFFNRLTRDDGDEWDEEWDDEYEPLLRRRPLYYDDEFEPLPEEPELRNYEEEMEQGRDQLRRHTEEESEGEGKTPH